MAQSSASRSRSASHAAGGVTGKWLAWAHLLTDSPTLRSTNTRVHVSHRKRTPERRFVKGRRKERQKDEDDVSRQRLAWADAWAVCVPPRDANTRVHVSHWKGTPERRFVKAAEGKDRSRKDEGKGMKEEFLRGRLSVEMVERLHRLVGEEARVEGMILRFIAGRYDAANLLDLPPQVAKEILKWPADFIRAAKNHCEPELNF